MSRLMSQYLKDDTITKGGNERKLQALRVHEKRTAVNDTDIRSCKLHIGCQQNDVGHIVKQEITQGL
jgi:hypothetical protein